MEIEKMQKKIDEIYNFLFGSINNPEKISFVSKVNLMFDELSFLKKSLIGSIVTILAFSFYVGQKIHAIDILSEQSYANSQQNDIIIDKIDDIENKIDKL